MRKPMEDLSQVLTVIVLSFNEEIHLRRLLKNLHTITESIIIVDSGSTDGTREIADSFGVRFYSNPWFDHATQFNWALDNCEIGTPWVMRMDCDEYLTDELIAEVSREIRTVPDEVCGFILPRRVVFMGRWIRHGGFYPQDLLRIWRTGKGKLEQRNMDEHVVISEGDTRRLLNDLVDHNLNDLTWWTDKHNRYASRETKDLLALNGDNTRHGEIQIRGQAARKRWLKERVYARFPLFVRPFLYFGYRYFVLFGFLDGIPGLIWHFLQGFWYRFLVDAKIYQSTLFESPPQSKSKENENALQTPTHSSKKL